MLNLYRNTTSLVDHGHRALDEAERTMLDAQRDLKKIRDQVAVAAIFAYIAAVAAVFTLVVLDGHLKRVKASGIAAGGFAGRV